MPNQDKDLRKDPFSTANQDELEYVEEAEDKLGPRNFIYSRKITLSNYDPRKKYETEDFSVTHDSFKEARIIVEAAVMNRIAELRQIKEHPTKE